MSTLTPTVIGSDTSTIILAITYCGCCSLLELEYTCRTGVNRIVDPYLGPI